MPSQNPRIRKLESVSRNRGLTMLSNRKSHVSRLRRNTGLSNEKVKGELSKSRAGGGMEAET